jgi:hypothetical protein
MPPITLPRRPRAREHDERDGPRQDRPTESASRDMLMVRLGLICGWKGGHLDVATGEHGSAETMRRRWPSNATGSSMICPLSSSPAARGERLGRVGPCRIVWRRDSVRLPASRVGAARPRSSHMSSPDSTPSTGRCFPPSAPIAQGFEVARTRSRTLRILSVRAGGPVLGRRPLQALQHRLSCPMRTGMVDCDVNQSRGACSALGQSAISAPARGSRRVQRSDTPLELVAGGWVLYNHARRNLVLRPRIRRQACVSSDLDFLSNNG